MPFINRESGVQADFIPEGEEPKSTPGTDRVDVPDSTTESAVRTAERRSIELSDPVYDAPEAIDPESDEGAADVVEVDEDVVSVEAPEAKEGEPEPGPAEDAGDLPRTDEGVIMDFVPDESDPTPEPLPEDEYDVTEVIEERTEDEADLVDEFAEKAAEAEDDEPEAETAED